MERDYTMTRGTPEKKSKCSGCDDDRPATAIDYLSIVRRVECYYKSFFNTEAERRSPALDRYLSLDVGVVHGTFLVEGWSTMLDRKLGD